MKCEHVIATQTKDLHNSLFVLTICLLASSADNICNLDPVAALQNVGLRPNLNRLTLLCFLKEKSGIFLKLNSAHVLSPSK